MHDLPAWPVRVEIPVAWADMDAFAHVNNTVYLRWFESARIAWFERAGLLNGGAHGVGPILASTHCRFLQPVVYPATVWAEATTIRLGRRSFEMAYRVRLRDTGALVAEGGGVVVLLDYAVGRSVEIDDALRGRMVAISNLVDT